MSKTTMLDLLKYMTTHITRSEDVEVEESETDGVHEYTINAPKEVMGLLIGKEGRTIRAIRSLARARAIVDQINMVVKLEEK